MARKTIPAQWEVVCDRCEEKAVYSQFDPDSLPKLKQYLGDTLVDEYDLCWNCHKLIATFIEEGRV